MSDEQHFPPQHQERQPGLRSEMEPKPLTDALWYRGSGKLEDKVAIITGADSGIGRSVAILFAREGADIAILYYDEHDDAEATKERVEKEGRRCLLISGDVGEEFFCRESVKKTVATYGKLDILVNNSAEQHPQPQLEDISAEQLEKTFRTNIFSMFYTTKAALAFLPEGGSIINTTSVTAYRGSSHLLDYSATKGAITAFTRSLSLSLAKRNIRVNAVAPGPIWTPLIPSTFAEDNVASFGGSVPMQRAGHPEEVAPAYVFLASRDASYVSGQVLHVNGGEIING